MKKKENIWTTYSLKTTLQQKIKDHGKTMNIMLPNPLIISSYMNNKFYLVVEKEEINSYCHRFCNPLIIFGDNAKNAELFYNYKNYTRESRAIATLVKKSDINGPYIIVSPINQFWLEESKTIQSLFEHCIETSHHRIRYIIERHLA